MGNRDVHNSKGWKLAASGIRRKVSPPLLICSYRMDSGLGSRRGLGGLSRDTSELAEPQDTQGHRVQWETIAGGSRALPLPACCPGHSAAFKGCCGRTANASLALTLLPELFSHPGTKANGAMDHIKSKHVALGVTARPGGSMGFSSWISCCQQAKSTAALGAQFCVLQQKTNTLKASKGPLRWTEGQESLTHDHCFEALPSGHGSALSRSHLVSSKQLELPPFLRAL